MDNKDLRLLTGSIVVVSCSAGTRSTLVYVRCGVIAVLVNHRGVVVVLLEDDDCRIVHHILQIFVNEIVYVLIR